MYISFGFRMPLVKCGIYKYFRIDSDLKIIAAPIEIINMMTINH